MTIKMLEMEQGSAEWLELRRRRRTASETATVMGCNPYQTPLQLARQKRQLDPPTEKTYAMEFGLANEAAVRKTASEYLAPASNSYEPAVLVSGDYLASLDGEMGDSIMEIKCPSSPRSGALQDGIYLPHWWQMQHQLMVSGAKRCHYVVRHPDDGELIYKIVLPEPDAFAELRDAWDSFWQEYMECDESELIEFQPIPADLRSLVDELMKGKDMQKQGKELFDNAKKKLCKELPNNSEGFGIRLMHIEKKGSTDWSAFQKAHPELDYEKFRKPSSTVVTVTDRRGR
jgi:putative phage-type endonuclease